MKQIKYLTALIITFFTSSISYAQNVQRPLTIGDTLPNLKFTMVNSSQTITREVTDFKGKAILLDFWGTWCAPCVFYLPKMDSLQQQFNDKLVILPVTDEKAEDVQTFLKKLNRLKKVTIYSVVNDVLAGKIPISFNRMFRHQTVPHYVLIDPNGVVKAITYPEQITAANLTKLIAGNILDLPIKDDVKEFEAANKDSTDFYLHKIWKDTNILEYHILTKILPEQHGSGGWGKNWVFMANTSIIRLYQIAYGNRDVGALGGSSTYKLLTSDSVRFTPDIGPNKATSQYQSMWRIAPGHEYYYVLKVPLSDSAKLYEKMKYDLAEYFPFISAKNETEKKQCLVLMKTGSNTSFMSKNDGEHSPLQRTPYFIKCIGTPMKSFVLNLELDYQLSGLQMIDETGYTGNVDLDIEARISDIEDLNRELNKYGLALKKEERDVPILVIRDLENPPKSNN